MTIKCTYWALLLGFLLRDFKRGRRVIVTHIFLGIPSTVLLHTVRVFERCISLTTAITVVLCVFVDNKRIYEVNRPSSLYSFADPASNKFPFTLCHTLCALDAYSCVPCSVTVVGLYNYSIPSSFTQNTGLCSVVKLAFD